MNQLVTSNTLMKQFRQKPCVDHVCPVTVSKTGFKNNSCFWSKECLTFTPLKFVGGCKNSMKDVKMIMRMAQGIHCKVPS